jgi:signal transduction histidine kinase
MKGLFSPLPLKRSFDILACSIARSSWKRRTIPSKRTATTWRSCALGQLVRRGPPPKKAGHTDRRFRGEWKNGGRRFIRRVKAADAYTHSGLEKAFFSRYIHTMFPTPALVATLLLFSGILLAGFFYGAFRSTPLTIMERVKILRRLTIIGGLVLAAGLFALNHVLVMRILVIADGLVLLIGAGLLCRTPKPMSRRADPIWQKDYIAKLEAELEERNRVQKELAFMASIAERDPNCVIELSANGDLGYRNVAADQTFPDLAVLGTRHPIFAGLSEVTSLLQQGQKNNLRRPLRFSGRVYEQQITWSDETQKLGLYMTDVTEWKRLDQLKTDLLNTVSHEFRTPLSSILAALKMSLSGMLGPMTDDQTKMLGMASESTMRLNRLINDLLDLSKIEAGKFEIRRESANLSELVERVALSFQASAEERGLKVSAVVKARDITLLVDADKIVQVLTNLTNNALKFTEKGEVRIVLQADAAQIRFSVEDTGKGISQEQLPNIFGKFQHSAKSVRGEKGTGLGLSLCKSLVELHGGKIWVESVAGHGSQFIFVLPRINAQAIFDQSLERLYEEAAAEGSRLAAFILRLTEAEGQSSFMQTEELACQLETIVRKKLRTENDLVLRDQATLYFIIGGLTKVDASALMEGLVNDFIPIAEKAGALEKVLVRARYTSLPEDGTVLEGLQARLAA